MHRVTFFALFLFPAFFSNAQTDIGIFAGPQMTFFQPDKTTNYNQKYYKFNNPQSDYNLGVFGWFHLKKGWLLDLNIGANSKTYVMDNYNLSLPGVSWDDQFNQSITSWVFSFGAMKKLSLKRWEFYPSVSVSYTLNSYAEYGYGYNASISKSNHDTFVYNSSMTNHIGYNYNSFGIGGGIVLHHQKTLKRFMLKIGYTYEFAQLPPDEYSIQAQSGSNSFNSSVKWQGHFSYINFDLMFYIKKWSPPDLSNKPHSH